MPLTKIEAQTMFTDLKGIARRGERLLVEIIQTRAWEPLGYSSLAAAWSTEIGDDIVIFSQKIRKAIIREFARTENLEDLPEIYGITSMLKKRLIGQYTFGVPVDRIGEATWWGEELELIYAADSAPEDWDHDQWAHQKAHFLDGGYQSTKWLSKESHRRHLDRVTVHRKATVARLPSKPSVLHVNVGEAEYERVTRVLNAAGKFQNDELKRVILAHVDRVEADLRVSV